VKAAAERSNAAVIVTGSVRTDGAQARITMHLIDAAGGAYLWSAAIDRSLDQVFVVQEEVARLIAEALKREWIGGPQSRNVRHPAQNLAAYNLYVQGR